MTLGLVLTLRLQHWHYGKSTFHLTLLHFDFLFFFNIMKWPPPYVHLPPVYFCILGQIFDCFIFCCWRAPSHPNTIIQSCSPCWDAVPSPSYIALSSLCGSFLGFIPVTFFFMCCIPNGFSFIVCFITRTPGPFSLHLFQLKFFFFFFYYFLIFIFSHAL